ncbi:hypothetical protein [Trebonia sp.]|uniref:hypothetical protein n=1 Tax=Trebonia sp. TaxID=2767075 RepID=UPI00262450DA|nr:hypothetical protein [Trebonia sp.]
MVRLGESATAADLTTLTADDVHGAYAELAAYDNSRNTLTGAVPTAILSHSRNGFRL